MSFVSEWKKRKRKGKVDFECDFHIGVKVNEDKWVLWEEEEKEEKEEERMQLIYIMFKKIRNTNQRKDKWKGSYSMGEGVSFASKWKTRNEKV